jgi:predicted amidohydrolase YtcJ
MAQTKIFSAKNIITLNNYRPWATHVAVRDGRVLGVGTLSDLEPWGPYTLDDRFKDKTLLPGFVEGHGHMFDATMWRNVYAGYFPRTDVHGTAHQGVQSISEVVDMLKQKEAALSDPNQPLVAWCFDPIYYGRERMTREHLDSVSGMKLTHKWRCALALRRLQI